MGNGYLAMAGVTCQDRGRWLPTNTLGAQEEKDSRLNSWVGSAALVACSPDLWRQLRRGLIQKIPFFLFLLIFFPSVPT